MSRDPNLDGQKATCAKCKATYLIGVPHICHNNDRKTAEARLEKFLGEFTIEHE